LDCLLPAEQPGSGCRGSDDLESGFFGSESCQNTRHVRVCRATGGLADLAREIIVRGIYGGTA